MTLFLACAAGCAESPSITDPVSADRAAVTFIELGSVSCVPCQQMQPIMQSLSARYGSAQLDVHFIDVLKDRKAAEPYKIRIMPTQVFLDTDGAEFHRHEGFYPEASIDSLLQSRGLSPASRKARRIVDALNIATHRRPS